jgi:hypothetical protein
MSCGRDLAAQDAVLARASEHDEVVLWFGPELFCQAILVRLLAELPDAATGLSRTERLILDALAPGPRTGPELFVAANGPEPRRWMTDTILMDRVRRWSAPPVPLVHVNGTGAGMRAEVRRSAAAEQVGGRKRTRWR